MVQRGLMFSLVVWITILVYNSGLVQHFTENATRIAPEISQQVKPFIQTILNGNGTTQDIKNGIMSTFGLRTPDEPTAPAIITEYKLKHHNLNLWQSLPTHHFMNLFGFYNISLLGRYISILPPIHLSIPVSPSRALQIRHPSETDPSLAAYFRPYIERLPVEDPDEPQEVPTSQVPPILLYHLASTSEIVLAVGLALPTLFFLIYLMVILYRCICPKHYAEWRSSWTKKKSLSNNNNVLNTEIDPDTYLIMETLPIKLVGHNQEIESIVSDDNLVCSVCLSGNIRVWDAMSGECVSIIDRSNSDNACKSDIQRCASKDNVFFTKTPTDGVEEDDAFHWSHVGDIEQNFPRFSRGPWTSDSGMSSPTGGSSEQTNFVVGSEAALQSQRHQRNDSRSNDFGFGRSKEEIIHQSPLNYQPVWCMNTKGTWLILGCSGGRVELWDVITGTLLNVYNFSNIGVTSLHLDRNKLYVARMNGVVEFLLIDVCELSPDEDSSTRQSSSPRDKLQIVWLHSLRAHSHPITVLTVFGGHLITGSQDHLMKVFYCETGTLIYTLHGHMGALSALHIDQLNPSFAASGCQEGMICIWDLLTGTCVYTIQAHQGSVLNLITTPAYLISLGSNDCFCIWEKNQGHLIHSIRQQNFCSDLVLLTNNILVTANQNRLVLWDTNFGEALRVVILGMDDHLSIRQLRLIGRAIVCSYGNEMCVVHFPAMTEKGE